MGGAIPAVNWHAVAEKHRNEAELLQHALTVVTAQRDALQRQLEAALEAGLALAREATQAPSPTPIDQIFRAIRQSRTGRPGPL